MILGGKTVPHAFLKAGNDVQVIQRCTKIPYTTLREARRKIGRTRKPVGVVAMGTGKMNAYRCKVCGAYHTGHRD